MVSRSRPGPDGTIGVAVFVIGGGIWLARRKMQAQA